MGTFTVWTVQQGLATFAFFWIAAVGWGVGSWCVSKVLK